MNAADLKGLEPGAEISRDIFMVGVYTAQRVSDYSNIKKETFENLVLYMASIIEDLNSAVQNAKDEDDW